MKQYQSLCVRDCRIHHSDNLIEHGFALPIPGKICFQRADHLVAWGAFDDIELPCREFEVEQDPKLEAGDIFANASR